jgi:GGDEF domain-containing protein
MLGEIPVSLGASVGGGVWPEHGHTANELVKHADAAMYRDKTRRSRSHPRRRQHA